MTKQIFLKPASTANDNEKRDIQNCVDGAPESLQHNVLRGTNDRKAKRFVCGDRAGLIVGDFHRDQGRTDTLTICFRSSLDDH